MRISFLVTLGVSILLFTSSFLVELPAWRSEAIRHIGILLLPLLIIRRQAQLILQLTQGPSASYTVIEAQKTS